MDSIPVISQLKSVVLGFAGQKEKAVEVQKEFVDTFPIFSQIKSGVQWYNGETEEAWKTQQKCGNFLNSVADATPVVGHVKGAVHHYYGQNEERDRSWFASSRSTAVLTGGLIGSVGGPAGMVATGIAAGAAVDGATMAINAKYNDKNESVGVFAAVDKARNEPSVENVFDAVVSVALDGVTGYAAGNTTVGQAHMTRTHWRSFTYKLAKARNLGIELPRPMKINVHPSPLGLPVAGLSHATKDENNKKDELLSKL